MLEFDDDDFEVDEADFDDECEYDAMMLDTDFSYYDDDDYECVDDDY